MTAPLLQIADRPATEVSQETSVQDAVKKMLEARVGAVAVVEGDSLVGIFTERDLMARVVGAGREATETKVSEVMVTDPVAVSPDTPRAEALELMIRKHFRHLPLVDDDGQVLGMLSIRNLLQHQVKRMREGIESLEQYMGADGPGG